MRHAFPETTRFFSTFVRDSEQNKAAGAELVSARNLFSLTRQLSDPALDLIVVHASPHGPLEGVVRTIFRRSALSGHLPILRNFAQQLLKRGTRAPVAVLDLHDSPSIFACNLHLLETATLYFKRELPPIVGSFSRGPARFPRVDSGSVRTTGMRCRGSGQYRLECPTACWVTIILNIYPKTRTSTSSLRAD